MKETLINLTPHEVIVIGGRCNTKIPASGTVARVSEVSVPAGTHNGVPLVSTTHGEVTGLPAFQPGVLLIVSALVRAALPTRTDLASPGHRL